MTKHLINFKNSIIVQAYWILLFAILFLFLGMFIPRWYIKYIDDRDYFVIEMPLTTDKPEYYPCENVNIVSKRHAHLDLYVRVHLELVKVVDGKFERVQTQEFNKTVNKGDEVALNVFKLPCNLDPGLYFYRGTTTYQIQGVDKYFNFISDNFRVRR